MLSLFKIYSIMQMNRTNKQRLMDMDYSGYQRGEGKGWDEGVVCDIAQGCPHSRKHPWHLQGAIQTSQHGHNLGPPYSWASALQIAHESCTTGSRWSHCTRDFCLF